MSSSESTNIEKLPNEVLQRIFDHLNLESKLSAGLTCRRWLNILRPIFVHLTDVLLTFEDDYCHPASAVRVQKGSADSETPAAPSPNKKRHMTIDEDSGSGMLTVNLCACPQHSLAHRHSFDIVLTAAGPPVKKLIIEDYLLQKGCFVDADLLTSFSKKCPKLQTIELHHVDLSRISEKELLEAFRLERLTELFLEQCSWAAWTEASLNRALKSIFLCAVHLREVHITNCQLLNDRTLRFLAKSCLYLWYVDFSGCRSITANGLSFFFYYMPLRHSDMLYIKLLNTRIDGTELHYRLYSNSHFGGESSNDRDWSVCNFSMETGHRACSFQNRYVPGKTVIVFM